MVARLSKGCVAGVLLGLVPFLTQVPGFGTVTRNIAGFCTYTDFVALLLGLLAIICGFNGMRASRRADLPVNLPLGLIAMGLGVYQFLLGGGVFGCQATAG